MAKQDGGPAFPQIVGENPMLQINEGKVTVVGSGMSLRDYFAAKAMAALIISKDWDKDADNERGVARVSFILADAMLAEREKP